MIGLNESSRRPEGQPLVEVSALPSQTSGEEIRFWRAAHLPGIELMTARNSGRIWRVFHDSYAICVIPPARTRRPVAATWRYRRREFTYRPGVVSAEEPGELHVNTRVQGPANFWVAFLDPSLVREAAAEMGIAGTPHLGVAVTEAPAVHAAFCRLYEALRHSATRLVQETYLAACLRTLFQTCGERVPAPPPSGRIHPGTTLARDFLHAHFDRAVRLADLAALAGLSRFHFAHIFAQTYGLSPHAYQTQLRVAEARRALRSGVRPHQIDAGFVDQSHLGKHFKRAWGLTPALYANVKAMHSLPRLTN